MNDTAKYLDKHTQPSMKTAIMKEIVYWLEPVKEAKWLFNTTLNEAINNKILLGETI